MIRVAAFDVSLTSTGWATLDLRSDAWTLEVGVIRAGDRAGVDRLEWIGDRAFDVLRSAALVVLEGPAHSRALQAGHHELAGLWWHVAHLAHTVGAPLAVIVPSTLKSYACGTTTGIDKRAMVAAFRREFPDVDLPLVGRDDAVDAGWLAAVAAHRLGAPIVEPTPHRLKRVEAATWPDDGRLPAYLGRTDAP